MDGERHVNAFLPLAQIRAACAGYRHELVTELRTLNYPDVMTLMRSLKGHRGHAPASGARGRPDVARPSRRAAGGLPVPAGQFPLSYHLAYGVIYRD